MMAGNQQRAIAAISCMLAISCMSAGSSVTRDPGVPSDAELFAAVVRSLAANGDAPLFVDPRPLVGLPRIRSADSVLAESGLVLDSSAVSELIPSAVVFPDTSDLARVHPSIVENRSRILRELGVPEGDALHRPPCPGLLVPPPGPGQPPRDRSGCPEERQRIVIASEAWAGGAYWPGFIDERESGRARGHWTLRVTQRIDTPRHRTFDVTDYVLERGTSTGTWTVVKTVHQLIVE